MILSQNCAAVDPLFPFVTHCFLNCKDQRCLPRQCTRILGHHTTLHNAAVVETRNVTHLSLHQIVAHFGLDWQSCVLLPTSYCMPDEDNEF